MPEEVLHDPAFAWRLWSWCGLWLSILFAAALVHLLSARGE